MTESTFNTDDPLAFFLTWTTYGTWLPGDDRGWNRKDESGVQKPSPTLEFAAHKRMTEPEYRMTDVQREIVKSTIEKHCEIRGWCLHVANPRSNHVHVVVTAKGQSPQVVCKQLKAWCTRKLKSAGVNRENFWTECSSKRCVNSEEELHRVIYYATEGQDRKGRDTQQPPLPNAATNPNAAYQPDAQASVPQPIPNAPSKPKNNGRK